MKKNVYWIILLALFTTVKIIPNNAKSTNDFRDYENAPDNVKQFYYLNHTYQTLNFVLAQKKKYYPLNKALMSIWDAMTALDNIIDESDPDTENTQTIHAFQTAEQLRKDGHPRWLILTGLIHDLGKVLTLFGEPQWAVVGDTFPVGCAYSNKIVFHNYFVNNKDINNPQLQTQYGIYKPQCGLDNVHISWGHDEYLYQVVKNYLPAPALYIIRYHSFYAAHKEEEYTHLMNDYDKKMMKWVKLFNKYDLYSKSSEPVNVSELMPFYQELVTEFFPKNVRW